MGIYIEAKVFKRRTARSHPMYGIVCGSQSVSADTVVYDGNFTAQVIYIPQ